LTDQTTDKSFTVKWNPPTKPNGVIKNYKIAIQFLNFSYFIPSTCNNDFKKSFEEVVLADSGNNFTFQEAFPYASYMIQVGAINGEEASGFSDKQTVTTLPGIYNLSRCRILFIIKVILLQASPEKVSNLIVAQDEPTIDQPYNKTVSISWNLPCRSNAKIEKFEVHCKQVEGQKSELKYSVVAVERQEHFYMDTNELLPDHTYNITVHAVTNEGEQGKEESSILRIKAGCKKS
jgi:hypothetical protein